MPAESVHAGGCRSQTCGDSRRVTEARTSPRPLWPQRLATLLLPAICSLVLFALPAAQGRATGLPDAYPLRPVDTSSPRATLQGFIAAMAEIETGMTGVIKSYHESGRLYLSADERQRQREILARGARIARYLDVSEISPVLRQTITPERVLQLNEVLSRIALPPFDAIPDKDAVARDSLKRWRLPDTEIDIVRVEAGPRTGEWLFSAATVERLPEFYTRVKGLPYKPGPALDLAAVYRAVSDNRASSLYDAYVNSPAGLLLFPPKWVLRLPDWAKTRIVDVTVWQWIGLAIGMTVGLLLLLGVRGGARRLGRRGDDDTGPRWPSLLLPLAIILVMGVFAPAILKIIRISGNVLVVLTFAETIASYLAAAWLVMVGAGVTAEAIVGSERLLPQSLDGQLIRLMSRFVGIVLAIALLMEAADELGFPAFSVLAGLGVGGLAVALAARDSLANLFGSVLIMFEKPFRVGHLIRLGGTEGFVEDVGFRSSRIRTYDNSLISVPNSTVVNATIENLTARTSFRERLVIQVTYDTPRQKIEEFCQGLRQIIEQTEAARPNPSVFFHDFSESSLDITVTFFLAVPSAREEMQEREIILLKIMDLATELGVEFAFPTRTVHLGAAPAAAKETDVAAILRVAD